MTEVEYIKQYFKGKSILITGGTGFIGKVLIEKLLRSCPDLENIYVLMRPKKSKALYERVKHMLSSPLFNLLKEKDPNCLKKIIAINGNITEIGLGLSDSDRQILIDKIQVFYHAAASVKFDDFLQDAIFVNLRSTKEASLLALQMKKIEVFMHVSTTYCNIDNRKVVEEKLYPPNGNWKEVIDVAENTDLNIFNILSQKFTEGFPNTYTYTKQLAEHCVNDMLVGKIPAIIFRPSVVISTLLEPYKGFLDNFNGPCGLLIAGGSGLLRTVYAASDVNTDYMAVDNIVKAMIVAAWHKVQYGNRYELSIYHGSKYDIVDFKLESLLEYGKKLYWDVPFQRKIWYPGNSSTKCFYNYFINVILFHIIPALTLDVGLRIAGYPPMFFKIQRKIYIANIAISHFMLNDWKFVNEKNKSLLNYIPKHEMGEFYFNFFPRDEKVIYEYYRISCDEARKILLKEDEEITQSTRTKTLWLYILDLLVHWAFYFAMFWLIICKYNLLGVLYTWLKNYWTHI